MPGADLEVERATRDDSDAQLYLYHRVTHPTLQVVALELGSDTGLRFIGSTR